jgi:hypothetical protein
MFKTISVMNLRSFDIRYKDGTFSTVANDRMEAIRDFFKAVKEGKIKKENLGLIVTIKDGRKKIGVRTVFALKLLGIIDFDELYANLSQIGTFSKDQIEHMIENDSKFVEGV